MRDFGVKVKLDPVKEIVNQKRVVIVEDSIIRGTTSKMRIKTLWIKNFIGLGSLCYPSLPGMLEATGLDEDSFCLACFTGEHPIKPREGFSKLCLES